MFTHRLAPIDGSKNAVAARDTAVQLSALSGAKLTILTVYRHHSMLEASFSMVRPEEPGNMDDILRGHAEEVAGIAKTRAIEMGATGARAFVRNGPVARSIVAFASQQGVDLIVLGGRGLGSVEGYLLGSVSHKVTGLAECPVKVV